MATYTAIPNSDIETDKPIRAVTGRALRDNPIAIAEGAAGAPRVKTSALQSSERMTTANVTSRVAAAGAGGVGTYAFLGRMQSTSITGITAFGATRQGSALRPAGILSGTSTGFQENASIGNSYAGEDTALAGTWRCLGRDGSADAGSGPRGATLWVRIS